jgi:hypothetical protein
MGDASQAACNPRSSCTLTHECHTGGGARGARTPDLLHAMQALFQLSYGPAPWYRAYAGRREWLPVTDCSP